MLRLWSDSCDCVVPLPTDSADMVGVNSVEDIACLVCVAVALEEVASDELSSLSEWSLDWFCVLAGVASRRSGFALVGSHLKPLPLNIYKTIFFVYKWHRMTSFGEPQHLHVFLTIRNYIKKKSSIILPQCDVTWVCDSGDFQADWAWYDKNWVRG